MSATVSNREDATRNPTNEGFECKPSTSRVSGKICTPSRSSTILDETSGDDTPSSTKAGRRSSFKSSELPLMVGYMREWNPHDIAAKRNRFLGIRESNTDRGSSPVEDTGWRSTRYLGAWEVLQPVDTRKNGRRRPRCAWCSITHSPGSCPASGWTCRYCFRKGHTLEMCPDWTGRHPVLNGGGVSRAAENREEGSVAEDNSGVLDRFFGCLRCLQSRRRRPS